MKHVLIIDDALEVGRMYRAALETLDATLSVRVVPSAEEANLELARQPVDLMICDVLLPGISGLDFVRKIRRRNKDLRIISISGMKDESMEKQAMDAGANLFMRKPLEIPLFLQTVSEYLGLRRAEAVVDEPVERKKDFAQTAVSETSEIKSLSDVLTRLRHELGAQCVMLLDEYGKPSAKAGEFPDTDFNDVWTPALMASLSANERISRLLNAGYPESVIAVKGKTYDLVAGAVGAYVLLMALPGRSVLRMPLAVEAVLDTARILVKMLTDMGVKGVIQTVPATAEPIVPGTASAPAAASPAVVEPEGKKPKTAPLEKPQPVMDENAAREFEELLNGAKVSLEPNAVDAFWESATNAPSTELPASDVLTYDQAARLGLAPDEVIAQKKKQHG